MALNLDPKVPVETAELIHVFLNGDAQECVVAMYNIAKQGAEDNPVMDSVSDTFREFQNFFNEQLVPSANKVKENLMAFSEFATAFNNLDFAKVRATEDLGKVSDHNYDAASDL